MLNQNPFSSQRPVLALFLFSQRMIFRFLERCLAIFMQVRQALITSIRQDPNVLRDVELIILEQLEVMLAALAKGGAHNFSRF